MKFGPESLALPRMGAIEWNIVKLGARGDIVARHAEGAQTVFGIGRARKILKELGGGWAIRHYQEPWRAPSEE